ncbi:TPA: DUF551 domain-containing protein [Providencia alcalifaciens]
MQGTNTTEFEKWCADEIGLTESYVKSKRKINTLGMLQYRNAEIEKRFMAYKAGLISGASVGCSHAKAKGTNWVKVSDRLPTEGEPVIVVYGEHIQNITYELISCGVDCEELRWIPHNNSDYDSAPLEIFDHWMYIKDLPLPPMPEGE